MIMALYKYCIFYYYLLLTSRTVDLLLFGVVFALLLNGLD